MATWRDVMASAVQRVFGDSMRRQTTLIYVNDDENEIANVSQKMNDEISNGGRKIIFCKDVDEYEDFMCEMFSDDLAMIHVIVRDRLAEQAVMKTHTMKQIKCFFIFGKTPANDEQIIWAQQYSKIALWNNYVINGSYHHDEDNPEQVFKEMWTNIESWDNQMATKQEQSEDAILEESELSYVGELFADCSFTFFKTFSCIFDIQVFHTILKCRSGLSDRSELIKTLKDKFPGSLKSINEFEQKYKSDDAIKWYIKEPFIYSELNRALRTMHIDQLLQYRFVLQDICLQLRKLMTQQSNNENLTVYRGQIINRIEWIELLYCCDRHMPFRINSFFSTSKDRTAAIGFILSKKNDDFLTIPILFKITAPRQGAPLDRPFADISHISHLPDEKEVLFGPGQVFVINSFDPMIEDNQTIYVVQMSLENNVASKLLSSASIMDGLSDSLGICGFCRLADFCKKFKRYDDAKKIYHRSLIENNNKLHKAVCYRALAGLALMEGDHESDATYIKLAEDIEHESDEISSPPGTAQFNYSPCIFLLKPKNFEGFSLLPPLPDPDRPLSEFQIELPMDFLEKSVDTCFHWGMSMMKKKMYSDALTQFKLALFFTQHTKIVPTDSLFIARCYIQIGNAYRKLGSNDEALDNFHLALEQSATLPFDEQADVLVNIAELLEILQNYMESLAKYIEAAEIYQRNNSMTDSEEQKHIEECIKRVVSHFIHD